MATTAKYLFNNGNADDSSGNGRNGAIAGSGPTFATVGPGPIVGTKFTKDYTDANFIELPSSVYTGISTTGTIKFSFFTTFSDVGRVPIASDHGVYGQFFLIVQSSSFYIRVPTVSGFTDFSTSNYNWRAGQWYTIFIYWESGSCKVDILDTFTGVKTNIANQSITADFSFCRYVTIGRDAVSTDYAILGCIDNVEFRDNASSTETETYTKQTIIASLGHSYVQGTNCVTHLNQNAWRRNFQDYLDNIGAKNYLLVGHINQGTSYVRTPYTDGEGGWFISEVDAAVTGFLTADFPSFNPNNTYALMMGPIEYNDAHSGHNPDDFKTSYLSVINKISSYSSNIKIMMVTNPVPPHETPVPVADFNAKTREVYAESLAARKNVYLADWANNPPFDWCPDEIHPSEPVGNDDMGEYMASNLYNILNEQSPTSFSIASGFFLIK